MRHQLEMKRPPCAELARLEKVAVGHDVSRHLLTLGHVNLGLVQTREVGGSRYVRHDLTEKGLALAKRMAGAIAPKMRETMDDHRTALVAMQNSNRV
jgi:hypothetical protein